MWRLLFECLNSSFSGVQIRNFFSNPDSSRSGGIPVVQYSARTFFSLPSLLRTKIFSQLFSTAEQSSFENFPKGLFSYFSKTSDMLRFWGKYCELPLGFHFSGDHFPLGRRIFSRPLFLLVNCIMKIIRIGGHSKKKRLNFFRLRACQTPFLDSRHRLWGLMRQFFAKNARCCQIFFKIKK